MRDVRVDMSEGASLNLHHPDPRREVFAHFFRNAIFAASENIIDVGGDCPS